MIYLFDIDGVLTDTGVNINEDFKQWFIGWSHTKTYGLVTGSTYERTIEQVGTEITERAIIVANCMGNSITQEGRTVVLNEFEFTEEEEQYLLNKINSSPYPVRAGTHIAKRPGSVNFSIVGRDASTRQRAEYKHYDSQTHERLSIAQEFKEKFPRFDVFIGGDISIDICLRGAHKGQILEFVCNYAPNIDIWFYGDKMGSWGIDKPLADQIKVTNAGKSFHISGGYEETKNLLK